MNAILMLAVLSTGQAADAGSWQSDYGAALRQAKKVGKPLLIVIDRPREASARVEQISHRQDISGQDNGQDRLLQSYVLCRVDAGTEYGAAVAKAFGTSRFPYTAVIDKTASAVLFTKTGQFGGDEWTATLVRYQRGEQPVSYQAPVDYHYQPRFHRAFCSS